MVRGDLRVLVEVVTNESDLTCYEFKKDKIYPPLKAEIISESPLILQFHDFYSPGTFEDTHYPSEIYLDTKQELIDFVLGLKSSTSTLQAINFHGPGQGSSNSLFQSFRDIQLQLVF